MENELDSVGFCWLRSAFDSSEIIQLQEQMDLIKSDIAKAGQLVRDPLVFAETLGKVREDPPGERDVGGLDLDPCAVHEGLQDRQEGVCG